MKAAVLEIRGLHKRFHGGGWVIEDCSLAVDPGEILYVLGASGSGKTTLLRLISGFETPDAGKILQDGRTISRPGWIEPPEQRNIGFVFQDYAIFPHLTVGENVSFGLTRRFYERLLEPWVRLLGGNGPTRPNLTRGEVEERVHELMALSGMSGFEQRYPHELSGGQQQRVALARALAPRPRLMLLDEPFSNLDTALRQRIRVEVKNVLKQLGTTSIMVTHDQEEAINLADRIAVLNQGRVEQVGTPYELLHAPASRFVATFIGMSDFIRGRASGGEVETELGRFPLPKERAASVKGEVDVLVRPDHLLPATNGQGVPTRVVKTEFVGVQTLYTLRLPSGATIQALFPGHADLPPGTVASVQFAPPSIVVFPAE